MQWTHQIKTLEPSKSSTQKHCRCLYFVAVWVSSAMSAPLPRAKQQSQAGVSTAVDYPTIKKKIGGNS